MEWMSSRAEAEMRAAGKKMMEEAAKRKAESETKKIGQWKITIKGTSKHTKEDVETFIDQLIQFTKDCDEKNPNIEMSVEPIIEAD